MSDKPIGVDAADDAATLPVIPLTRPAVGEEEAQAAADAVRSGWLSEGERVVAFERAVAERVGATYAVAVSSGTAALHLALLGAGIRPGDEVLLPSFGSVAPANAVVYVGARPVFVEIDQRNYNIAPMMIEPLITSRTRAIIPVDYLGLPAALAPIAGIARRFNLTMIEDASSAIGGTYRGKPIGSVSPITCFSFSQSRTITTGEGGMLVTNEREIALRAQRLRSRGVGATESAPPRLRSASLLDEPYEELGYSYRLSETQAAIGLAQLTRLDDILAQRRALAQRYIELLADEPGVTTPYAAAHAPHTFQSYCVRLDPRQTPPRSFIIERLRARGITAQRGGATIHEEPYYVARLGRISLPLSEQA
ncbi:MAG TPA: DegT/DnrJ/EryC1/StrS family aminotransferase, partial [Ktedonobacterales bacterium]|nr:DegT/DnrJ/EryC1/StrS family aminotransferase [Ktedonobacterales bacterium]